LRVTGPLFLVFLDGEQLDEPGRIAPAPAQAISTLIAADGTPVRPAQTVVKCVRALGADEGHVPACLPSPHSPGPAIS
jgi:hypothetical protein